MHGTLVARPAASMFGRYYTDENGITYRDTGSAWVPLNSMPVGGQPGQALVKAGAGNYSLGWGCPVVGSLPATPGTWQECILDNVNTGWSPWHMIWDGSTWRFLGGAPIQGYDGGDHVFGSGFAIGPSLAVPAKGMYVVAGSWEAWGDSTPYSVVLSGAGATSDPVSPSTTGTDATHAYTESFTRMMQTGGSGSIGMVFSGNGSAHVRRLALVITPVFLNP
jgi:hypothetical protein